VVRAAVLAALVLAAPAHAATVSVDPTRLGQSVPKSYLGLSVEWDSLGAYAQHATRLRALLAPLARSQGGLSLRIGGNSADASWWNPTGRRRPRIVLHNLDEATVRDAGAVAGALGGPVTLGVNLALRDPQNALQLVERARERFGVETLELGNEPDLYTAAKTFRVPGAVHRRVRKHRFYEPRSYGRDVDRYMDVLGDDARYSVGGFARPFWWSSLPGLLDRWNDRAGVLSVHMYALPYCDAPPPPASWLMTREASRTLASKIRPIAGLARKRGLSLRVSEMNSAVCGGRRGISDRAYAAVWLADILFALVSEGVRQTDVHTWRHAVYAPFTPGGRPRAAFAGMSAFARAAPYGSRLARTRVSGGVRAWATKDDAGTVRVLLVAPRAETVRVSVPGRRCRSVWRPGGSFSSCGLVRMKPRSLAVVELAPE
jgi:hypothetical protein